MCDQPNEDKSSTRPLLRDRVRSQLHYSQGRVQHAADDLTVTIESHSSASDDVRFVRPEGGGDESYFISHVEQTLGHQNRRVGF